MNLTATDIKTTVIFRLYDAVDTLNKLQLFRFRSTEIN